MAVVTDAGNQHPKLLWKKKHTNGTHVRITRGKTFGIWQSFGFCSKAGCWTSSRKQRWCICSA